MTRSLITRIWFVFIVTVMGAAVSVPASGGPYTGMYVFGDSLSDSGNLAALTDPTQVITGNSYIPNAPYASKQFTNGDVWVKGVATALGLATYAAPALAGGGNFAFGGARVA